METKRDFTVDIIGKDTGTRYRGTFTVKMVLSRTEKFKVDEERRKAIGFNGKEALSETIIEAHILADLQTRIVSAPTWWKLSDEGRGIEDDDVLEQIYEGFGKISAEFKKERAQALKAALTELAVEKEEKGE